MRTLFSVVCLVVVGMGAAFLWNSLMRLGGALGGVLAVALARLPPAWRFGLGTTVAFVGQAYVGLAFVAWTTAWTRLAAARADVSGIFVWPVAFIAVAVPAFWHLGAALSAPREPGTIYVQREALSFTFYAVLLGFLVFAIFPGIAAIAWPWVPLVSAAARV
jgi:hypothetical protein